MNRKEYMQLVEIALKDIPQSEKEEAIQYYNDYFDDAGEENEQEVISSLGSPAKLAESIIKEFSTGESRFESNRGNMGQNTTQNTYTENSPKKEKMSGWIIALIIFLTVLASPLLLALAATVFGVLVGVFGAIFGFAGSGIAGGSSYFCINRRSRRCLGDIGSTYFKCGAWHGTAF